MLWILCRVIKEITFLCLRQEWTFPDSQPAALKSGVALFLQPTPLVKMPFVSGLALC